MGFEWGEPDFDSIPLTITNYLDTVGEKGTITLVVWYNRDAVVPHIIDTIEIDV